MNRQLELYLHIPFCVRKCAYCDFLSFSGDESVRRRYVERLKEEIVKMGAVCREYTVSTVFVGGGTPSVLNPEWIQEIFEELRNSFHFEEDAEISMEANPGTVTKEKIFMYRSAGINRLSFGLQSADNRELKVLGRIHTWEEFLESWKLARDGGFSNINIDLMSALPGQTAASWENTLKQAADLEPEHISAYSLIIEEGTPFFEQYGNEKGGKLLPPEEEERKMYHLTKEILKAQGYDRYEISNYAKPGYECRHNIGYWTGAPYLGLGLGAASYFEGKRFVNESDVAGYLSSEPGIPGDVQRLTQKEQQEEFFFVGLRMIRGVSLKEFEAKFHTPAQVVYPGVLERFVREGAAVLADGRFWLTDYGLDVSNYVMAEFLQD